MASTTLEEKINKIRQKNEEIRRRHEEVEADKQNAAKLNALVKMVPPTDWPERKEPPEFSNPLPSRNNGHSKPKASAREYRGQQQQYHAGGGDGKKIHVFAEGDGPPPDPTYNFLADSEREERTREDSRDNDRFRGRGGSARGASRKRGGGRDGYSKEYRGSGPGPVDASKPEYEAWRAERNRIDEARISRQRTAEGNWRREWDNNKINVEEDKAGATKAARLDMGDIIRKDHKELDRWQTDGNNYDSPRGRGGKQYVSRGAPRGSHNNRVYQHSNSFEQSHGPVSPPVTKSPPSPNGIDERTVVATDKSIKVIVNHGTTAPKGPVMSVKVSSASIAGTGRVGPRQKPRILYSSQSETEVIGHDHEKFSSHKSSDDKANRVSFNRDIDDQHRYVPKSPHPQRKSESNSKSPYLARKEFKFDSQQQRHGEIAPKSPYLQQKEIKDCPKSPNFQKKADFTNRDSNARQKNDKSPTDTFKSSHSQRRTSDKMKNDSQKFQGSRKSDDASTPKPQRTNKRTDKSKSFQHSNSKETQESCTIENNAQLNTLGSGTSEESTKNMSNGNEIHDEISNTNNDYEKDSSENPVANETVEEKKSEDDDVSKQNINPKTLNPSYGLEKVIESMPEDTKSIDNSEPIILIRSDANECSESIHVSDNGTEKELNLQNDETSTAADSATLHSSQGKADECYDNIKDSEADQKVPEITSAVHEEIKKATSDEKNTSIVTQGIKNVQDISVDEPKHEQNATSSADPDSLKKIEEKADIVKDELQSVINEISLEPEKVTNQTSLAENTLESTSLVEKVDSSHKLKPETQKQNSEEQVSNNIDHQVVKDSEGEENTVI